RWDHDLPRQVRHLGLHALLVQWLTGEPPRHRSERDRRVGLDVQDHVGAAGGHVRDPLEQESLLLGRAVRHLLAHPFTPPCVMPATKNRCSSTYRTTIGMDVSNTPANSSG